jgi:hypothetical protein
VICACIVLCLLSACGGDKQAVVLTASDAPSTIAAATPSPTSDATNHGPRLAIPEASLEVNLPPDFELCGRSEIEPTDAQYIVCNSKTNRTRDLLIEVWSTHLAASLGFNGDLSDFRNGYLTLRYPSDPEPVRSWATLRSDIATIAGHESLRIEGQTSSLLKQELWLVLRNGQLLHFVMNAARDDRPIAEAVFSAMIDSAVLSD